MFRRFAAAFAARKPHVFPFSSSTNFPAATLLCSTGLTVLGSTTLLFAFGEDKHATSTKLLVSGGDKKSLAISTPAPTPIAPPVPPATTPKTQEVSYTTPLDSILFPAIEPYMTGRMQTNDGHDLYYECCGNPNGKPLLFLHGGPGSGISPNMRRYFDPKVYNIILLDQRGAGNSLPHASLHNNTLWHLVADCEQLRRLLHVEKWVINGGSFGSTLAIAYAETYPNAVSALILRGIFLLRDEEIDFFYQPWGGASRLFADAYHDFIELIPVNERRDVVTAYHRRLTDEDVSIQLNYAKRWTNWEMKTIKLIPPPPRPANEGEMDDKFNLAFARIENHFFYNHGFLSSDDLLLTNAHKIKHIPTTIIHGRYDCCCPMKNAVDLKAVLTAADYIIVKDAGHASSEPGIAHAIVQAGIKYGAN